VKDITPPSGLVRVPICLDSGKQPSDLCSKDPRGSRVVTELFIDGTQPTSICDTHVEAKVNKTNGKLATSNTPAQDIESRVFIKRDYTPSVTLQDQQWVLPKESDDAAVPTGNINNNQGGDTTGGTIIEGNTNTSPGTTGNTPSTGSNTNTGTTVH
ncbi:MAG: hypothetical protein Q8930_15585, partial [Bacillota bacterium]|nr:hypothetical protein [Bacillota bacterium]